MDVLVTGTTEYIGSAIAPTLQTCRCTVADLARSAAAVNQLEALEVNPLAGDLPQPLFNHLKEESYVG